jgi:nucleotide-binding universal stress UspA family protein
VRVISTVAPPANLTPEPWPGSQEYFAEVIRIEHEQADSIIEKAVSRLGSAKDKPWTVTATVLDGSPKRIIVEEAERWGADLIVVGSHGYGSWNRFLLGSVSQAVSLHAPCSVEIVRRAAATVSEKS